ncbi:MAG: asparagine synthase-related protein, partial [Prolixibacteraceae bacterium]|nr:asparagine synthase-related protein [Prolixibacteraceae bacterium]
MSKIVVGLSGGVDSSVAAYLLKEQGHEVIGLFMVNWHDRTGAFTSACTWEDDALIARMVAKKLGIPFHIIDLSEHYKKRVIDYMFAEYEAGRTPNPDILCNREIKFGPFLKKAFEIGGDFVATGHFCRVSEGKLLKGVDSSKDQSYFLCGLSKEQLSRVMFPVGGLLKSQVREIAAAAGLVTAEKKDSTGI